MTETCDHLVRDGMLVSELGSSDPHVDTCSACQRELTRFRFLDDIRRMPAWTPAPAGWRARVWAEIDAVERPAEEATSDGGVAVSGRARRAGQERETWWQRWLNAARRRPRWLAVPVLAAAAAVALLVFVPRSPPLRFGLDIEIRPAPGEPHRTVAGVVGDRVTARATRADAVWVYLADGSLVARCPGTGAGDGCRVTTRGVELTFTLTVATPHRIVAVSGGGAVTPSGDLDRDLRAARARGARLQIQTIAVAPGA